MRKLVIVLVALLTLCSCSMMQHATYSRGYLDSCVGNTRANIIRTLGPPTFTVYDGYGWKTLVYIGHKGIFAYTKDYERSVTDLPTAEFVFDEFGICQKVNVYNTGSVNAVSVYGTLAIIATFFLLFI